MRVELVRPSRLTPTPVLPSPTMVLLMIRPKLTGRFGAAAVSPANLMPDDPAITLFWTTTPGTRFPAFS